MHIDSLSVYHVSMPLISPWRTAYGEDAAVESILVRMQSGDAVAWGESSPLAAPCYSPEWAAGVYACVTKWLAPALVGQAIESGEDLQQRLAHFKGNQFAKAALDTAWWVLEAKLQNKPLYQVLGGQRDRFDVGADFGVMDTVDELIAAIGPAVDRGFKRVKLKYRPGWDIHMLRAVRSVYPTHALHIDCNSGYTLDEDFEMFCRLDDFGLEMIEQPLGHDDLIDHAQLQEAISTPVCLDESINSVRRAEQALRTRACGWINIKPGRVGGLTAALAIHNLCRDEGIPCWVGGMLESAVGASICVALATLDNFIYPADIFPSSRFYHQDLGTPAIELVDGPDGSPQVAALDAPGTGVEPDLERLEKCCVARAEFRSR